MKFGDLPANLTNGEYRSLIERLIPFATANIQKRCRPSGRLLSNQVQVTWQDGEHQGWGIDPFYLIVDRGRIVRLSRDRNLNSRWRDINLEQDDLRPGGYSDGLKIVAMLDRLATQLSPNGVAEIPAGYPLAEVRRALGWHEVDRGFEEPEEPTHKGFTSPLVVIGIMLVLMAVLWLLI